MQRITEKKERALGTRLFLKAFRCNSPKCALVRRPSKPGMHGNKKGGKGRRTLSEFGRQLQEKQKVQISYGISNHQMQQLFRGRKETGKVLESLEKRLDNVVFRLGLADSRIIARQLINHGHILVKNKKVSAPSYEVKIGEKVGLNANSRKLKIFDGLELKMKKFDPPKWLNLDKEKFTGELVDGPQEINLTFDLDLVAAYYSR